MPPTHDVLNQPEPLVGYNLFQTNQALRDALKFNAPALDTAPGLWQAADRSAPDAQRAR